MFRLNTRRIATSFLGVGMLCASAAHASLIVGGDAASQAAATSILDIVFVIDTSGSMTDDIDTIGAVAQTTIRNLNCPDTDCFVRARFMGITGTAGIFDETVTSYVSSRGGVPVSNSSEDNGPAVTDLANFYEWGTDAVAGQKNYRAVVTIGDEGTENGSPVTQADYDVAFQANQASIANNVLLFSWVADDPASAAVLPLFQTMAVGGAGGGYSFSNTGGGFISGPLNDVTVEQQLEDIICVAATGGGNEIPTPASLPLAAVALIGGGLSWRRQRSNNAGRPEAS